MDSLGKVSLELTIGDAPTERLEFDLSQNSGDILELCRLEETTGFSTDAFSEGATVTFALWRALIWWKVSARFPDADIDYATFTFDASTLEAVPEPPAAPQPEPSADDVEAELFAGAAAATSPKV